MGAIELASISAEEHLLGACLGSGTALVAVSGSGLKPEDFSGVSHEILFRAMLEVSEKGQDVNLTTVTAHLEAGDKLGLVGGLGSLERLNELGELSYAANDYADIVKDRSIRRKMFDAAQGIVNTIYHEQDVRKMLSDCEREVYRVSDAMGGGATKGMSAADLVDLYKNRRAKPERIPYPFHTLNKETSGRERGSLTVWGGYSSDGKTIIGMQSLIAAAQAGYTVGYFSLEMTEEELLYHMLSMMTGVPKSVIEEGSCNLVTEDIVSEAARKLSELPITTFHDPEYTPTEIRGIQMREKFDLIVVDYLQRFTYIDFMEIPRIAKQFKNIALTTKCCVDLLSQLTPAQVAVGQNPFPPPNMNSIYGGKATAHEANNLLFVWAHRKMDEYGKWQRTGTGQIISAKQRGGKGEMEFDVNFDQDRIMWMEPGHENVYSLPQTNTR